jgi:transglutaminase-like putative cysteine protease
MPILSVRHLTRYRYREPVFFGEHRLMFRPQESYDQRLLESRLAIGPEPAELRYVQDVFGNCVTIARFAERSRELTFESFVRLEHTPSPLATDTDDEIDASVRYPFAYSAEDMPDLLRSIERHHPDPDGALEASVSPPASSQATSIRPRLRTVTSPAAAAATPTPGSASTCRAAAGWSSTPPTASSATTT